jgi:hypothetical protein
MNFLGTACDQIADRDGARGKLRTFIKQMGGFEERRHVDPMKSRAQTRHEIDGGLKRRCRPARP